MAKDDDQLSWSWNELTGGVRDELTDEEAAAVVLFSGVPESKVESYKQQYLELFDAIPD